MQFQIVRLSLLSMIKTDRRFQIDGNNISPADFKVPPYKLIKRYDKIIRKGSNNEPPIKGFALSGESKIDSTAIVLSQPYAILLFIENFSIPVSKWDKKFAEVYAAAKEKNIPVYIVTSQPDIAAKEITKTAFADIIILSCDFTAVRTAARVSPNLYLLKEGTILNKWGPLWIWFCFKKY